jgi:hypothetical protein
MLNEWSLIQHDLYRTGIRGKNYSQALNMATWLAVATFAEIGIRRVTKELIALLTGQDLDDWDETFGKELVGQLLGKVPFLSQVVSSLNYGTIPIPTVEIFSQMLEKFKYSVSAKKFETRERNAIIATLMALGTIGGIPGTMQASQLIKSKAKLKKKTYSF